MPTPIVSKLEVFGHSIAAGFPYVPTNDLRYSSRLASRLGAAETNAAVGGAYAATHDGNGWRLVMQSIIPPHGQDVVLLHFGVNDLSTYGTPAYREPFKAAMRAMIARMRSSALFEDLSGTVAYSGTDWTAQANTGFNSGSTYRQCTTNGATVTISVPSYFQGGTIVLGFMASTNVGDGAVHTITVDGVGAGSLDTRGTQVTGKVNGPVKRLTGLSAGAHTIVITTSSVTNFTFFDYWAIEDPTPPVILLVNQNQLSHLNNFPSLTDTVIDDLNARIAEVAAEFDDYVIVSDVDAALAKNNDYFNSDGLHPNSLGHQVMQDVLLNDLIQSGLLELDRDLERLVLDPSEVDDQRVSLELNSGAIRVRPEGPDWGDHEFSGYMSEGQVGEVPVDGRLPNRKVMIPLQILGGNNGDFDAARVQLQAKAALLEREGGSLKRELYNGGSLYLDIVNATVGFGGSSHQARGHADTEVDLVLETLPDWYGEEYGPIDDDFSSDTVSDYEISAGGSVLVTGGQLTVNTSSSQYNLRHRGGEFYDMQTTVKAVVGATTEPSVSANVKVLDLNNFICATLDGVSDKLRIFKCDAGSFSQLSSDEPVTTPLAAGSTWWVRCRIEGDLVTAEAFSSDPASNAPSDTISYTLTGANSTKFGAGVPGSGGMFFSTPSGTPTLGISEIVIEPNVFVETSAPELTRTLPNIPGNYPARCRIEVEERSGQAQLGVLWGVRSRYYDSASTASLAFGAEGVTPLDAAVTSTETGAHDSSGGSGLTVISHGSIGSEWTPVLSVRGSGGTHKTHRGTYRVYARLQSQDNLSVPARVRFAWAVGDLSSPVINPTYDIPASKGAGSGMWYDADLGEVRLDPASGTHRWQGVLQAQRGEGAVNTSLIVDRIWLVPVDEFSGCISAPLSFEPGVVGYFARDDFNQTTGNLSGKTADVGGTWAGSGDADQFSVDATAHNVRRTAVSDTAGTGRTAILGSTVVSDVVASVYVATSSDHDELEQGLFLRWVDANNWLKLSILYTGVANIAIIGLWKRVGGGTPEQLATSLNTVRYPGLGTVLKAAVVGDKFIWAWAGVGAGTINSGADPDLAAGGALDDGKVGIYDENPVATAATRLYDNFWAYVPNVDSVMFAHQSAQLTTEGMFREDSAGAAYGPVANVVGDLPRIPPSGPEGRTCELFVKASRGDFDTLPDTGIDDISAKVFYRPSWLFVPDES